jgi:uncharacterized coiled-coil protein SlyX
MQPKPEHRISALGKRVTHLEDTIEELSSDQAEELRAIRQEIKQLNDGMMASFKQIGDTFVKIEESLEAAKATMATKEDISRLEARIDHIEATQGAKLDQILALLQQRPSE